MAEKYRQTHHRNPSFLKIAGILIASILVSNFVVFNFSSSGQLGMARLSAFVALVVCGTICLRLIYRNLTYFIYEIIDGKLFFERAIGKSNHIYFHVGREDIIGFNRYEDTKDIGNKEYKTFKFLINKDTSNWYVVDFYKKDKKYRLIIDPDENFLDGINKWFEDK